LSWLGALQIGNNGLRFYGIGHATFYAGNAGFNLSFRIG